MTRIQCSLVDIIYHSLLSTVDHELFVLQICKTVSALAETCLLVCINILGNFSRHHSKLIFWYFKFYHMLKDSVHEKYRGYFVGRLLITISTHLVFYSRGKIAEYFCCSMNKLMPSLKRFG